MWLWALGATAPEPRHLVTAGAILALVIAGAWVAARQGGEDD
jgi:hypothetical protein